MSPSLYPGYPWPTPPPPMHKMFPMKHDDAAAATMPPLVVVMGAGFGHNRPVHNTSLRWFRAHPMLFDRCRENGRSGGTLSFQRLAPTSVVPAMSQTPHLKLDDTAAAHQLTNVSAISFAGTLATPMASAQCSDGSHARQSLIWSVQYNGKRGVNIDGLPATQSQAGSLGYSGSWAGTQRFEIWPTDLGPGYAPHPCVKKCQPHAGAVPQNEHGGPCDATDNGDQGNHPARLCWHCRLTMKAGFLPGHPPRAISTQAWIWCGLHIPTLSKSPARIRGRIKSVFSDHNPHRKEAPPTYAVWYV